MNSLIQVMYMTPELREGLYRVDPMELGLGLVRRSQLQHMSKVIFCPNQDRIYHIGCRA